MSSRSSEESLTILGPLSRIAEQRDERMPHRICILTDGDDSTWCPSAVLAELSADIMNSVHLDGKACQAIADESLESSEYAIYDVAYMLDLLKFIAKRLGELDVETAEERSISQIKAALETIGIFVEE